jgi:hypothetical protein
MPYDPIIVTFDAIVKSRLSSDGRRLVEVGCSDESCDSEGDVILQKALLDAAPHFIRSGHLDINHYSELGHRIGIENPSSYIVGRPTDVLDYGGGKTGVRGEIRRSADGKHDAVKNKFDEFWDSLQTDPPVHWSASIYGFPLPGMIKDCREEECEFGATRFLIKGMDWRSMAFTTTPVNQNLTKFAKIVTAKAFVEILKAGPGSPLIPPTTVGLANAPSNGHGVLGETGPAAPGQLYLPHNVDGLIGQWKRHIEAECPVAGGVRSWIAFKRHFEICCGAPCDTAELLARALMHWLLTEAKRGRDAA